MHASSLSSEAARLPHRAIGLIAIVVLAYHVSLGALLRGLTLETPLAYLGLVPVLSLGLAWYRLAREPALRPIHDRQVDYIVGIALVGIAAAVAIVVPSTLGSRFWLDRVDLLSLPFFVAGLVCLLYGIRYVWILRVPILFLFLAWPVPYVTLVGRGLEVSTELTAAAAAALAIVVPTARAAAADGLFIVQNASQPFAVGIGAACAGVNSVVGFGVVGGGVAYALQGGIRNKIAWLVLGMAFVWLLNLVRIELIFLVGALFGQAAALDVFHPIAGLIIFNLAILGMLIVVSRFGLDYPSLAARSDGPLRNASPVRRARPALMVAVGFALALGAVNAGYARFQAVAGVLGDAQSARFDPATSRIDGWSARHVADYDHGRPFFGATSSWQRLVYRGEPTAGLRSDVPLYVDLIDTSEADKLAAFSVEACYNFHGFGIEDQASLQLGPGVVASVINYTRPKSGSRWSALWWEWPYRSGAGTRFERVVLLVPDGPNATYEGLSDDVQPLTSDSDFAETERFLVTVATAMLEGHFDALDKRTADSTR